MVAIETPEVKPAWLSKTVWVNAILILVDIVGMWVPQIKEYVDLDGVGLMFGTINLVLRAVTKNRISFW